MAMQESIAGSREYVAYLLLKAIAGTEGKLDANGISANREWVLKTYAQCLMTVVDPANVKVMLERLE